VSLRAWLTFAGVAVVWGIPYFFIKLAVADVSPAFIAWSRVALAALVLVPLAWRLGAFRGVRGRALAVAGYAAAEIAIPFVLIPFGEQRVSSSLTAILIASVPLMVALSTLWLASVERPDGPRLLGLVMGLVGVVALVGIDVAGNLQELVGALSVLAATACYAGATIVVKRHLADLHPLGPVAGALVVSTIALTPLAALSAPTSMPSTTALVSLVVLGLACTAAGLVLFFALIAEVGPTRATVVTYVNPAVAVVLGVTVLGERLGPVSVLGLGLILAGSWLSTGGWAGLRRPGRELS
jgi:drug/metabolite transporter (DMT)-like permease